MIVYCTTVGVLIKAGTFAGRDGAFVRISLYTVLAITSATQRGRSLCIVILAQK